MLNNFIGIKATGPTSLLTVRFVQTHVRASDPRSCWIAAMLIFKHAINNKDFFAAIVPVWIEVSLRCPTEQSRTISYLHQWHHSQALNHTPIPIGWMGINDFTLNLNWTYVPQLHEQSAPLFTEWCVRWTRWIQNVDASGIMARFITEGALTPKFLHLNQERAFEILSPPDSEQWTLLLPLHRLGALACAFLRLFRG